MNFKFKIVIAQAARLSLCNRTWPAPSLGTQPDVPYAKTGVNSFYFEDMLLQRLLFQNWLSSCCY
jgi:hypothetical protein